MEPLKLPTPVEIHQAFEQGEEAVTAMIYTTIGKMAERIQELENRLAKNSGNSGKPPSSDGLAKKPKNLRHKSGKKSGGQAGHPGSTLQAVENPKHIAMHAVKHCRACQGSLEEVAPVG